MSFHGLSQCQVSAVLHDAFIPLKPVPPGLTLNTLPNIAAAQCTTLALFATQLLCAPRKHLSDFTSVSFFFFFFFRDKVSLCSPGCLGTHSVDQAGLKRRDSSASANQMLGLKVMHYQRQAHLQLPKLHTNTDIRCLAQCHTSKSNRASRVLQKTASRLFHVF